MRCLLAAMICVRAVEDGLGGAVVLLQEDDGRLRVVALEVEDVADVGGAPGVDRLVGVADDADVGVGRRRQQPREHVLGDVGVLELVDQDVLVAVAVALRTSGAVAQQLDRLHEDVVEVEGAVLGQQRLVALVAAGRRSPRSRSVTLLAKASGPMQLALGLRDHGEDGARRVLARVQADTRRTIRFISAIWSRVVEDHEAARHADRLAVDAQDAGADGVEGAERDAARRRCRAGLDAVAQLARRLVGEGHGHDRGPAARPARRSRWAMRWAMTRVLPLPGPARISSGPFGVGDGIVLGGVEAFKNRHGLLTILTLLFCTDSLSARQSGNPASCGSVIARSRVLLGRTATPGLLGCSSQHQESTYLRKIAAPCLRAMHLWLRQRARNDAESAQAPPLR